MLCMRGKLGQGSFEYISIVAVALLLIIPSTVLFLNYSQSTGDQVLSSQFNFIGNTLLSKAEEMYVIGTYSWTTVDVNLPNSFTNATIYDNQDLVLTYQSRRGPSQAVFFPTRFNITSLNSTGEPCLEDVCDLDLRQGPNSLMVRSQGEIVTLERRN